VSESATPPLRVELLSDRHDRDGFTSGIEVLDRYLRQQAGQDTRRRFASCFVLVAADDPAPIGYYTLAATGIALADLPEPLTKKLPRYPIVPATLMGRLAIDGRQQSKGYGELLLFDAFSRTLRNEIASYAIVVDAKDENAAQFYRRYRFIPLVQGSRRLFLPVSEIAKIFAT